MKKNISYISKTSMCCACGACISICTKKAITLKKSSVGRFFAAVNSNCINCGLCLKVCPSHTTEHSFDNFFSLNKLDIAIGKANNTEILLNGQSGGAVTATLSALFRTSSIDAALLCNTETGHPYIVTEESQLKHSQKSYYTPVPLLTEVEKLMPYNSVAIVGLPCHIAGVTNIMRYKQIPIKYKLGLICDRNLCETISSGILNYFGIRDQGNAIIKWRDKTAEGYNYKNAPITVSHTRKGVIGVIPNNVRHRLKQLFTAPRCLCCPDKLNLCADIVYGDPWNIGNITEEGESLIIVNTPRGKEILTLAAKNNTLLLNRNCSKEELDTSQHISERKDQIKIYTRLLTWRNKSYPYQPSKYENCAPLEYLRALYCVCRFKFMELLPKVWIERYVIKKITQMINKG